MEWELHCHPHGLDDGGEVVGSTVWGEFACRRLDTASVGLFPYTVAPLPRLLLLPWRCRFWVCKPLKLLGKWYWWHLKSGKEVVLCYLVHILFSHLLLTALLCGRAQVLSLLYLQDRIRHEGLGDKNHKARLDQKSPALASLVTCRASPVISELLSPDLSHFRFPKRLRFYSHLSDCLQIA